MRIVGGRFRGRELQSPAGSGTRPTSDRVRESVFNILAHGVEGFDLAAAPVIDLFAGTGALGIEALSRGATYCLFVEDDVAARGIIRTNVDGLGLGGMTRIFKRDATDIGACTHKGGFRLAFLDPPYGQGLGDRALKALVDGGWLQHGAVVVIEERAGSEVSIPAALQPLDSRIYGDTEIRFLLHAKS